MRAFPFFCLVIALSFSPATEVGAAVYKYTDESGRSYFVDGETRIPERYRGSASQVQSARPAAPQASATEEEGTPAGQAESAEKAEKAEVVEPAARTITDKTLEQRARQEAAKLDQARAYQTPVMARGNRVLVPVELRLGGKDAHLMLLLDDKAPVTTIHRSAVEELRFPPGEQITLPGTGNRNVKAEKVVAGLVDIGPFELKDFPVVLVTPQGGTRAFDGTLGVDFLKDHPYTVDYEREMLRWKLPGQ